MNRSRNGHSIVLLIADSEMQQPEGHDTDDDWETDSGDEIEEEAATKCLFSDDVLPSVTAALEHDTTHFGFDFAQYVKQASFLVVICHADTALRLVWLAGV